MKETCNRPILLSRSLSYWRWAQYGVLLLGMALFITFFYFPDLGLNIMWNGLIPIAPALLVFVPGLWRNICPMATLSLIPRLFGFSARRALPRHTAAWLSLIGLAGLFVIVPLRHLSLDTNAPLTALMIGLSALLALSMGMAYEWRSGWCNALCPIHPVEKLYGHTPLITLPNVRCDECGKCSKPCADSRHAMNPTITGSSHIEKLVGHFIVGTFVGFIWGWNRLPDFHSSVSVPEMVAAYAWPYGGGLVTLAIYTVVYRWICQSAAERTLLVKCFSTAAVCMYYWYRIPALIGFGPNPGTGMLLDLSRELPLFPLFSHILTTSIFIWFMLLRKSGGSSWTTRPILMNSSISNSHLKIQVGR